MEFPIRTIICILNIRFATSLVTTRDCLIKWSQPIRATTRILTLVFLISSGHNSGSPRIYPPFRATTQGMASASLHPQSHHSKHLKLTQTPFEDLHPHALEITTPTMHIPILHMLMISLR